MSLSDCQFIELPEIASARGHLTFVEVGNHTSFNIKRVYCLYDVPGGAGREGHAHKTLHPGLKAMGIARGHERSTP